MEQDYSAEPYYTMGEIPLRSLNEVVIESKNRTIPPNWKFITQRLVGNGKKEVIQAYLFMANKLFKMPLPEGQQKRFSDYLYFLRCSGQLGWEWFDSWGMR